MKKELSSKLILDDFINKTILNDLEKDILIRYIKGESIVEMSFNISQSTSTISRTIAHIKEKYNNYKKIEISKLKILSE